MNTKRTRRILWTITTACGAGSAAALGWALLAPVAVEPPAATPTGRQTHVRETQLSSPSLPPLNAFAVVWEKGMPEEPPPRSVPPERPAPPPPPPLRVQLLATAVEEERSYAVMLDERNLVQVRTVDEFIGGARVTSIENGRVSLEHRGRAVTLALPQSRAGSPMAGGDEEAKDF